jgi:hypothetical protein
MAGSGVDYRTVGPDGQPCRQKTTATPSQLVSETNQGISVRVLAMEGVRRLSRPWLLQPPAWKTLLEATFGEGRKEAW